MAAAPALSLFAPEALDPRAGLMRLDRVEVFRAGTYDRGTPEERTYTVRDLDDAVRNFWRFYATRPPLLQPPAVVVPPAPSLAPVARMPEL